MSASDSRRPESPGGSERNRGVRDPIGRLLRGEVNRLQRIKARMIVEGMYDEAGSLETVIADLQWQCAEFQGGRGLPRFTRNPGRGDRRT